jgi:hypothetical protein
VVGVVAVLLVNGLASAQTPTSPKEPRSALLDEWVVTQFGFRIDLLKTGSSVEVIDRVRINNRCDFEWTRRSSREFLSLTKSLSTENSSQNPALIHPLNGEEVVPWEPLQGDVANLSIPLNGQCGWDVFSVILMTKQGQREWTFTP